MPPRPIARPIGVCLALLASVALGGGGPANVVLVVNQNSESSKEIANHYVELRGLPASNVIYLDYKGARESCGGKVFREQILGPVLETIDERGLSLQIDMVAYSTDFPWRVHLGGDYPKSVKFAPQVRPFASLTGATYLFPFVMGKNPGVVDQHTNWYVPTPSGVTPTSNLHRCRALAEVASRGFRSRYAWTEWGERAKTRDAGRRYLLSTMLGVTTGRGNTVEEVVESLRRAVRAEQSPPTGTVYFMRRNGPRSVPRHACYEPVAQQLREIGAPAKVMVGPTPRGADDVAGLVMGAATLGLDDLRIQPGAICEHLTSFGGVLSKGTAQTPLTDLIRAGAAGASGTVFEPYAIQCKFPLPSVQLHYRRGCSLAEAFYQSVASPYQLLIVGDPLCQPWAKRPSLKIEGWPGTPVSDNGLAELTNFGFKELGIETAPEPNKDEPATDASGEPGAEPQTEPAALSITPKIAPARGGGAAFWELFVDGRLRMRLPSGREASFTAEQLGPGWHELRCVGANPDAVESQSTEVASIEVLETSNGPVETVRLRIDAERVQFAERVPVSAAAPGAQRILLRQNQREVGRIEGESGGAFVDAELLGRGPIRLQAVAEPSGAASPPVWVVVE